MSQGDGHRPEVPIAWSGTAIGILGVLLAGILLPNNWLELVLLAVITFAVVGAVWYWHRYRAWLNLKFLSIVTAAVIPLLLLLGGRLSNDPGSTVEAVPTATTIQASTAAQSATIPPTAAETKSAASDSEASPTATLTVSTILSSPTPTATATPPLFTELRAGMSVAFAEQRLGTPISVSAEGEYTATLYRDTAHDRWIQIVHDQPGQILLLALTACDRADHMVITDPTGYDLILNETTIADAGVGTMFDVGIPSYRIGAHDFYALEGRYGGNPSGYKSWLVGTSDLCMSTGIDINALREGMLRMGVGEVPGNPPEDDWYNDPAIMAFRSSTPINVYAETSPAASLEQVDAYALVGFLRYTVRGLQ